MAELFGVASGALSIAGVAGQLAQSAAFLYDFIRDIRGAPKLVQILGEELRILTSILTEIQRSCIDQNPSLENALQHCQDRLRGLLTFVKKVDPAQHAKKRRRLWSQFRAALKRSDLTRNLRELDRCKLMLLQACNNVLSTEQKIHTDQLKTLVQRAEAISAEQNICTTTTGAIQNTVEEISDKSSSLQSTTGQVITITQETLAMMNESHTKVDRICYNTELIRAMAERLESAQQSLVKETLDDQKISLESVKKEVNRSVSRTLRRHLAEHFESLSADQVRQYPGDSEAIDSQHSGFPGRTPEFRRYYSWNEDRNASKADVETLPEQWIKTSSIDSRRSLIQNATFGTLSIRTTTASHFRKVGKGPPETKQVSTNTLTFFPPSWLSSQGAVMRYQRLEFSNTAGCQMIPHWSLSSVNIVPETSEIIEACQHHDLRTVCELFSQGRASPYDVDEGGRNLLGWVAVGLQFHVYVGKHSSFGRRLDDLNAIIAMLISYGVDSGCADLHNGNPTTLAAVCWSDTLSNLPTIASQEDHFNFILLKLLVSAKTDPFDGSDAFVEVSLKGEYTLLKFPGRTWPDETISKLQLELIMAQKEWQVTWNPWQLSELCSARWQHKSENVASLRCHVAFWVTGRAEDIQNYLYAKLDLLRKFLEHGLPQSEPELNRGVIYALHTAIHQGGEVIALLTEHTYGSCDRQPWIRHRFKKIVLIEKWLTETMLLLMTNNVPQVADPEVIDGLCQHAQRHNARTLCAWMKVLRACKKNYERGSGAGSRSGMDTFVSAADGAPAECDNAEEPNTDEEWETEDSDLESSGWETEEEMEEGYRFETAIDRDHYDAKNPDLDDQRRHTCDGAFDDYDEDYWEHVYPRIIRSSMDAPSQKVEEGTLHRLRRYVRRFLSMAS